jgi:Helicase associated domain
MDKQGVEVRLGQWVSYQRTENRKGSLREDRLKRLNSLPGFAWNLYGHKHGNNNWDRSYDALLEYEKEYGTCNVVNSYKVLVDGKCVKLGRWLGE